MNFLNTIFLLMNLTLRTVICMKDRMPKIAIIGGGIGGASASHFLNEFFDSDLLKIDLFEANKIGGRLATINIDGNDYESGGAIIHDKNKLMRYFAKHLGLEKRPFSGERFGIWNGNEFVFDESSYEIGTLAKLIYRYGLQPFYLDRHINAVLADFNKIYELQDNGVGFDNVSSLLSALNKGFPKSLEESIDDQLTKLGYSRLLIDELVKATIVVNYGQNIDVQSFVGCVSLAGAGSSLWSIKGGNKVVPERLISRNKNVRVVPSVVKRISYLSDDEVPQYAVYYIDESNSEIMRNIYDIVIIATPLTHDQKMSIEFDGFPDNINFEFPGNYQTTYATFVKGTLNMSHFGLNYPINSILSCDPDKTIISSVGKLSTVDGINSDVWKIFTRTPLTQDLMDKMFEKIDNVKEIKWKAYPKYSTDVYVNKFKLHDSLYHVNAIEWAASAMEMSAIGGRNVAILVYNDYKQKCENTDDKNHHQSYCSKRQKINTLFDSEF